MTIKTYTFDDLSFASAQEIKNHCKNLRLSISPGELIADPYNRDLLQQLVSLSSKTQTRLKGRAIKGWTTKTDTADGVGLAAILEDGSVLSFSANKLIDNYIMLAESMY